MGYTATAPIACLICKWVLLQKLDLGSLRGVPSSSKWIDSCKAIIESHRWVGNHFLEETIFFFPSAISHFRFNRLLKGVFEESVWDLDHGCWSLLKS